MGEIFLSIYQMLSFAWCDLSHQNNPMRQKEQDSFAKIDLSLVEILTNTTAGNKSVDTRNKLKPQISTLLSL